MEVKIRVYNGLVETNVSIEDALTSKKSFKDHPTLKLVRDITDCFVKQKYCSHTD